MVSKNIDDWLQDEYLHKARWEVRLSNDELVYQDDDRPGVKPNSAWERLGIYCVENKLNIQSMWLKFRSHTEFIGEGWPGFFFCKGIMAGFGGMEEYFVTGRLEGDTIIAERWQVPTLIKQEFLEGGMVSVRDANESGICLIRNNYEV